MCSCLKSMCGKKEIAYFFWPPCGGRKIGETSNVRACNRNAPPLFFGPKGGSGPWGEWPMGGVAQAAMVFPSTHLNTAVLISSTFYFLNEGLLFVPLSSN